MEVVQEFNGQGKRGLGVGNQSQLHVVVLDPGSVLGYFQQNILGNTFQLGIRNDFSLANLRVPQNGQADDFIRVEDEMVPRFLVSQDGQTDLIRDTHLSHPLGKFLG